MTTANMINENMINNVIKIIGQKPINVQRWSTTIDTIIIKLQGFAYFKPINFEELNKVIKDIDWCKSTNDTVDKEVNKLLCQNRLDILINIVNTILISEEYPKCLKVSKIIPIRKLPRNNQLDNLRPIHLLSLYEKIVEKVIYKQLDSY